MKRLLLFIIVLLSVFLIFIIVTFLPKNYSINYLVNNILVTESYNKNTSSYHLLLKYKNMEYPIILNKSFNYKRNFIKDIKLIEENEIICLKIDEKYFDNPICSIKDQLVDYRIVNKDFFNKYLNNNDTMSYNTVDKKNYYNLDIYNYNNNILYLWNYKGFYIINKDNNNKIDILKNDNYQNNLMFQTDSIIIFPDYDSKYYFTKLYYIKKGDSKLYEINFNYEISYDSYFLGYKKNTFYLMDRKNKIEYSINIKKEKVKLIAQNNDDAIIYDKEWKNISLIKLINEEIKFNFPHKYEFRIINNNLYMIIDELLIKVSEIPITKIIYSQEDNVYFLSGDELYQYSLKDGVVKLLKNPEWNFNNNNQIFIFN